MTECRDCAKHARFPSWPGYTAGCGACHSRAFASLGDRWQQYEQRKRAWLEDNPGAWPLEVRDACARIREEIGL
jgi:hypothetical protein